MKHTCRHIGILRVFIFFHLRFHFFSVVFSVFPFFQFLFMLFFIFFIFIIFI